VTSYEKSNRHLNASLVYIEKETPSFYIDDKYFSTRAGSAELIRDIEFFGGSSNKDAGNDQIIRGNFCPIIGTDKKLNPSTIYTIKNKIDSVKSWITTLIQNTQPYFAITNRFKLEDTNTNKIVTAFRGDCFTNTVTIRLNRNFIDPVASSNDLIVDEFT
jgi:hypothetical protein